MNERSLAWAILIELDAARRRDPQTAEMVGQIDLPNFLGRVGATAEAYAPVVTELKSRGLVAEPSLDQLSVLNGGMYITSRGLDELSRLRTQASKAAEPLAPYATEQSLDVIRRAWPRFQAEGRPALYRVVEKGLLLSSAPGTRVADIFRELPPWMGYAHGSTAGDGITLRLLGIVLAIQDDAAPLLESFWRAFTIARHRFLTSADDADAKISSGDLGGSGADGTLGLTEVHIRTSFALLQSEMLLSGGGGIDDGERYGWEYTVSHNIYAYRDVETLSDFVRLRANEELARLQPSPKPTGTGPLHQPDPRKVFVIHGRDDEARQAVCSFLKDLDLHPIEWEELVQRTGKGTPYTGEVVELAFQEAQAVVAIFTPDDEVRLHPSLWNDDDTDDEKESRGQPRPNVYFEAGMAFMAQPTRTILVEIGRMRPASDLGGRNVVRLNGSSSSLNALKNRLATAECTLNDSSSDWMNTTRFSQLAALNRHQAIASDDRSALPTGFVLRSAPRAAEPGLRASLHSRGSAGSYLLEIVNTGGVALKDVRWSLSGAPNWSILESVLPAYPVPELAARERMPRIPVSVTLGGPAIVELHLQAVLPDGTAYETTSTLSIYG